MRFLFLALTSLALLTPSSITATPIYNPDSNGVHRMQTQHVRHVDEHGHVTYIHDQSDHRPDFCSIPGEEELCRLQIQAANEAPAIIDNGRPTSVFESNEPNELNNQGLHSVPKHILNQKEQIKDEIHPNDEIIHDSNGEEIIIHTEHPGNIRPAEDHPSNIRPNQKQHISHIMEDDPVEPTKRPKIPRSILSNTRHHVKTMGEQHTNDEIIDAEGEEIVIHTEHPPNIRPSEDENHPLSTQHIMKTMSISEDPVEPTKRPKIPHERSSTRHHVQTMDTSDDGFIPQEHARNIRDDLPPVDQQHPDNINTHPLQTQHREITKGDDIPSDSQQPGSFPPHPVNVLNSRPIIKLQKKIDV